jgi:hypothetical protein
MPIKHKIFLRWWLFISILSAALAYGFNTGAFHTLWDIDFTKISFLIIGLLALSSIFCGRIAWRLSSYLNQKNYDINLVKDIERDVDASWFVSDLFFTIGMVGTVIGFIVMLSGFDSIDFSNPDTTRQMISSLGSGMSTALYTTLTGLVCSVLLKIQCFMLSYEIEKEK